MWWSNSAAISRFSSACFNAPSRPSWRITELGSRPARNSSINSLRIVITGSRPLTQGLRYDLHTNFQIGSSQQMRWSRRGADLLLQVRCAVYNGTLGSGFGQRFRPANDIPDYTPS